jgi:ATP-dependent DNA helicase DinG
VPWSRPTILNAARRAAFGGSAHEDTAVRHRLAQAFGRLIRSAGDRGAFVLLGAAVPSRLLSAFPPGCEVERVPLSAATARIRAFLGGSAEGAGDCAAEAAPLGGPDAFGDRPAR